MASEILLQNMGKQKKVIYHIGAWSGNFGDSIIQKSIYDHLNALAELKYELDFRYYNCQQTEFTEELIEQINSNGDLLLVGGGGLIFYRPQDKSKSGWQWNIDIKLISAIKIPFVVYGIGYNQFEYDPTDFIPITNLHLQATVKNAALFSVRNSGTKQELITRGCDASKIEIVPDSGMFISSRQIQIPGLNRNKFRIGINWTSDREEQTFSPPWEENKHKFLNAVTNLLNYAQKEKNAQVFYIGHMSKDFDSKIIFHLKNTLIENPTIIDEEFCSLYPATIDNSPYIVDVYRQMDTVLGMRGHSNIASFGQNTPFIGLGSHRKIRYFLNDLDMADNYFDTRTESPALYTLEKMKERLLYIIKNHAAIKIKMRFEFEKQEKIFNTFNLKLLSLLR